MKVFLKTMMEDLPENQEHIFSIRMNTYFQITRIP